MSNTVLALYRALKPLNDDATTDKMLSILIEIPNDAQSGFWIRDEKAGNVCLFKHDSFPNKVLEYVQGSADDSVSTLYEEHAIFATLRALTEARNYLIMEIGSVLMALPSTVAVYDGGRERQVVLRELGTAQIIDTLAHFTRTDLATL